LERFELIAIDFAHNLKPSPKINEDIVLIEIGEDSLQGLGRWPFPRDYHASLIEVLKQAQAKMVIFDVLFSESTAWDSILTESAQSFERAYFPFAFRLKEDAQEKVLKADSIDAPLIKSLKEASAGSGFINKLVDIDGKVRRVPLFIDFKNELYPHLSLKAACDYLNIPIKQVEINKGYVKIGERLRIPTDRQGAALLNFAGPWVETFQHFSYVDVLASYYELQQGAPARVDLDKLKDKVCFIGLTATGTHELGPVPIEKSYPMLGVHANLFNMITKDAYLRRLSPWQNTSILIIISALFFLLVYIAKPLVGLVISIGLIVLVFIVFVLVFSLYGIWIDFVYLAVSAAIIYLGVTLNRYITEIRKRLKIQKELAVAHSIQQSFLPDETPKITGLDIASNVITAKEIGGDLYDFMKLDGEKLGVIVGDVSGKGVPAALFMAKVATLFKIFAKEEVFASNVLGKINEELAHDYRSGLFVTLCYAIISKDKEKLSFSNAGHLPLIIVRGANQDIETITHEEGMAAGLMEGAAFSDKQVTLSKKDAIILYTDGVTEAMDARRHEFGMEGLKKVLVQTKELSAEEILKMLLASIKRFQGKAAQHDDITAVVIKIK